MPVYLLYKDCKLLQGYGIVSRNFPVDNKSNNKYGHIQINARIADKDTITVPWNI